MTPADSAGSGPPGSNEDQAQTLMELADGLMERARTLASQADQLIAALDLAARRLVESGRGVEASPIVAPVRLLERAPATAESNQGVPAVAATEDVGPTAAAATESVQPVSDGIRLLITTMALAGTGHDEIAKRLREDFGFEDADDVIKRAGA
jgi:hypothetical protein